MMRLFLLGALFVLAVAAPVQAQIGIDIGIRLPGPPAFLVVQGSPVYYAPRAPANVFFYAHQYWIFTNGWYVGPTWNGPKNATSATGVSAKSTGIGAAERAARRDSPSKDAARD